MTDEIKSQTGLYEGDRIRIEGNWGAEYDCTVERFRDCLGVFKTDEHRMASAFTPLCDLYGYGAGSSTGYISNFGEYVKDPVAMWMQLPPMTPTPQDRRSSDD